MKLHKQRSVFAACLLGLGLLAVAGCPMVVPTAGDTTLMPEPGTYYVDQIDGKLHYYQLAQSRNENGEWMQLDSVDDWYVGPGWYELSDDHTWLWDENAEGVTLDEVIQLHDPAPEAPEAS